MVPKGVERFSDQIMRKQSAHDPEKCEAVFGIMGKQSTFRLMVRDSDWIAA